MNRYLVWMLIGITVGSFSTAVQVDADPTLSPWIAAGTVLVVALLAALVGYSLGRPRVEDPVE